MKIQSIAYQTLITVNFSVASRLYVQSRAYSHARDMTPEKVEDGNVEAMEGIIRDLRALGDAFGRYAEGPEEACIHLPAEELEFLAQVCQPPAEESVLSEDEFRSKLSFQTWRFVSSLHGLSGSLAIPSVPDAIVAAASEACHDRLTPELKAMAEHSPTGLVEVRPDGDITPFMGGEQAQGSIVIGKRKAPEAEAEAEVQAQAQAE